MFEAVAIELNPVAFEDLKENIKLNKVEGKIRPFLGNVKDFSFDKDFLGKFDRVVMPLPKGGEDFLDDAIRFVKPEGGVIHYYQFVSVDAPFVVPRRQIANACAKANKKFEVVGEKKVRDYSPEMIQVVVDFKVWSV
jgi:tRNA G37 N-methylase Trm5